MNVDGFWEKANGDFDWDCLMDFKEDECDLCSHLQMVECISNKFMLRWVELGEKCKIYLVAI